MIGTTIGGCSQLLLMRRGLSHLCRSSWSFRVCVGDDIRQGINEVEQGSKKWLILREGGHGVLPHYTPESDEKVDRPGPGNALLSPELPSAG